MIESICIRIDLNIPQGVTDHPKLRTLKKISDHYSQLGKKIYLCSHLGQPSQKEPSLSFKSIVDLLKNTYQLPISLKTSFQKEEKPGLYLLENLRFDPREKENCPSLAHDLLSLADQVYFEALACSHRAHSSIYHLTRDRKTKLGYFAQRELTLWNEIKNSSDCLFLIGGAKAKTKLPLIKELSKSDHVFVFGALAHCLQKTGFNFGKSFIPQKPENFFLTKENLKKITVAQDFVWLEPSSKMTLASQAPCSESTIIDIGNNSLQKLKHLIKRHKNIIWMGPPCWFERFAKSQSSISKIIQFIEPSQRLILGGGETAQCVLQESPNLKALVIEAGGALMNFLSGSELQIAYSA